MEGNDQQDKEVREFEIDLLTPKKTTDVVTQALAHCTGFTEKHK